MKISKSYWINIGLICILIVASIIQLRSTYIDVKKNIDATAEHMKKSVFGEINYSASQLELLAESMEMVLNGEITNCIDLPPEIRWDNNSYAAVTKFNDKTSLIGIGNGNFLEDHVLQEMNKISFFNSSFEILKQNYDDIQWIYYLSKNNFINIYPKTDMRAEEFIPSAYEYDFYKLTLPSENVDKTVKFTEIYEDQLGKGLMITMTKPIYSGEEYYGALALDYTVATLSTFLSYEGNELMNIFVANDYNQIIASNTDFSGKKSLKDYFLTEYGIILDSLKLRDNEIYGDYMILFIEDDIFPLKMYVVVNRMLMYFLVLGKIYPIIFSILGLIIILNLYNRSVRINKSLDQSERKFRSIFEQSTSFATILDSEGQLIYANSTALHFIHETIDEIIGKKFYDIEWWTHSELLSGFIRDSIKEVIDGYFVKRDVSIIDKAGKERCFTLSIFGIRDDLGELEYIAATGIEITERKQMEAKLEGLSKTDTLTQTHNRRGMYEVIDQCVARYKRKQAPFSVLICDIDFFKNVNDTYGHVVGDEILINLVALLKKSARPYDVVGRWGGEEFLILLQDTEIEDSIIVANRIRQDVSKHPFKSDLTNHIIYINITIGIKAYDPQYDIRQIIKMADDALYYGKEHGRNQVVNFDDISFKQI